MPPDLDRYAERLKSVLERASNISANETELRLAIEPAIRDAVRELYELDLSQITTKRRNAAGRYDTCYGGVVVEYESSVRTQAEKNHAARQALDYFHAIRKESADAAVTAAVCDGRVWGYLMIDEQADLFTRSVQEPADHFAWYTNSVAACRRFLQLVGSHRQTPVSGDRLLREFGTGTDLAARVIGLLLEGVHGRDRTNKIELLYREWLRSLEVAYGDLVQTNSPLLSSVRESFGVTTAPRATSGEALFALHTYFALVVRLLAAEVLAISTGDRRSQPSSWSALDEGDFVERFIAMEHGCLLAGLDISNLLESEVFSWYTEIIAENIILQDACRDLCASFAKFAVPRLAYGSIPTTDLLRELYQGLAPRQLRRALGEYLTPYWLAQAVLDFLRQANVNLTSATVLDPTCGTGSFLQPLVASRLRELRRRRGDAITSQEVQGVLDTVVGIDINPVAVLATRMNYLMSLGELAALGKFRIPVWLADSILLPSPPQRQISMEDWKWGDLRELETVLPRPFPIPATFVSQHALTKLASVIRRNMLPNGTSSSKEEFITGLSIEMGPDSDTPIVSDAREWERATLVISKLYSYLAELHRNRKDEVWTQMIENRFAPLFIGRFDVVVGNPPWLTWTRLPQAWREHTADIWRSYGLWTPPVEPGAVAPPPRSLHTSDIATLSLAVSIDNYLKPKGVLAFITPKALINGDPGNRAFRQYRLKPEYDLDGRRSVDIRFAPLAIHDFSEVKPFSPEAGNEPIVLIVQRDHEATFPVPGTRWARRTAGARIEARDWNVARSGFLKEESVSWHPVSTFSPSALAWWRNGETVLRGEPNLYTFGKGLDTRGANGIYFVETRGRVDRYDLIRIANLPNAGRSISIREKGPQVSQVESDLVVPLVRGRDVQAFKVQPGGYILLPHNPVSRSEELDGRTLATRYPYTYAFLRIFRDKLLSRSPYMGFRPDESCWWQVYGTEHMTRGFLVCVTEIASPPRCAVLEPIWDNNLERTVLPVVDHKIIFYSTMDRHEAYYLSGLINAPIVHSFMSRFMNQIAVSPQTLQRVPMPVFTSDNPLHSGIAELSLEAHRNRSNEDTIGRIDRAVKELLKNA